MATRSRRHRRATAPLCAVALVAAAVGAPRAARADRPPHAVAQVTTPDAHADSQKHFEKAREYYHSGSYREAIGELEQALALDPGAKVLVYNLGVVHEKLGNIDDALKYFRKYSTMDLDPKEREKNEVDLRRLEGAKKELDAKRAAAAENHGDRPPPPIIVTPETPNGRLDALTITFAAVTVAGLGVGTIFAIKANGDKPPAGFVTGRDGTFADLQNKTDTAHREAVIADIGFGIGIAAGVTTVLLYALRPRVERAPPTPPPEQAKKAAVAAVPIRGGAAVLVQGSF